MSKTIIKPVAAKLNNKLVAKFVSRTAAGILTGTQQSHISKVVLGKRGTANGYGWTNTKFRPTMFGKNAAPINQVNSDGEIVAIYRDVEAAASMLEITASAISRALEKGTKYKGFRWISV